MTFAVAIRPGVYEDRINAWMRSPHGSNVKNFPIFNGATQQIVIAQAASKFHRVARVGTRDSMIQVRLERP